MVFFFAMEDSFVYFWGIHVSSAACKLPDVSHIVSNGVNYNTVSKDAMGAGGE